MSTVAGDAARASSPPLKRERCLRTAFSSLIVAPAASSSRVSACFSSSVTGGAGAGVSAEPPPETRKITRSSAVAASASARSRAEAARPRAVRHRVAGLGDLDPRRRQPVAVLHDDEALADARPRGSSRPPAPSTRPPCRRPARARAARGRGRAGSGPALSARAVETEVAVQERGDVARGQRRAPDGGGRLARISRQACGASAGARRRPCRTSSVFGKAEADLRAAQLGMRVERRAGDGGDAALP